MSDEESNKMHFPDDENSFEYFNFMLSNYMDTVKNSTGPVKNAIGEICGILAKTKFLLQKDIADAIPPPAPKPKKKRAPRRFVIQTEPTQVEQNKNNGSFLEISKNKIAIQKNSIYDEVSRLQKEYSENTQGDGLEPALSTISNTNSTDSGENESQSPQPDEIISSSDQPSEPEACISSDDNSSSGEQNMSYFVTRNDNQVSFPEELLQFQSLSNETVYHMVSSNFIKTRA